MVLTVSKRQVLADRPYHHVLNAPLWSRQLGLLLRGDLHGALPTGSTQHPKILHLRWIGLSWCFFFWGGVVCWKRPSVGDSGRIGSISSISGTNKTCKTKNNNLRALDPSTHHQTTTKSHTNIIANTPYFGGGEVKEISCALSGIVSLGVVISTLLALRELIYEVF